MLKRIQVKNFKILQDTEISNFSKMNIFVGNNDCGKTSLLEAIYLALSWGEIPTLIQVNSFRSVRLDNTNKQFMFYNLNTDSTISLSAGVENRSIDISIRYYKDYVFMNLEKTREKSIDYIQNDVFEEKLETTVRTNDKEYKLTLNFNDKVIKQDALIQDHPLASFIGSSVKTSHLIRIIKKMRDSKRMQDFVKHLYEFNENIIDIEHDGTNIAINLNNLSGGLLDIKFMGGGFKKILTILSILLDNSDTNNFFYLCIDEIENGLHFSSCEKLLEILIGFIKERKIQLFVTTHSLEFLDIFRRVSERLHFNDHAIFKLSTTKQGLKIYNYDIEEAPYFSKDTLDPRG